MKQLKYLEKKYKEMGAEIERLKASKLKLSDDLKVTNYNNGDPIPQAISDEQWIEFGKAKIGAYCITEKGDYLYNWYVVDDKRGIAPKGWHVPTNKEWNSLEEELLDNPSYNGYRNSNGFYSNVSYYGCFWSSTVYSDADAWYRLLYCSYSDVYRYDSTKRYGFSLRCVKIIKEIIMTKERLLEIFEGKNSKWEGDNAYQGLQILGKYTDNPIQGAGHDIIYSENIDKILEAGLTEDEAEKLALLNWMISEDEDYFSCFV